MVSLAEFNPFDDAVRRDPHPFYALGRREGGVYEHPGFPVVSVFGHAAIRAILKDWQTFSSEFPDPPGITRPADIPPSMLLVDPPRHTRLRSLVSQAFTPRMVGRMAPRLEEIARGLIDAAVEAGEVDLVEALTYPLPVMAIAEMIGVPVEDRARFKHWSDELVASLGAGLFSPITAEQLAGQTRRIYELRDYFRPLAEARRTDPRDDLLSGLVAAEVEGSKLTFDEMMQTLVLLLVAGNETTTTLISNAVLALLAHPDELRRLRADPGLVENTVEEVMRFTSPVQLDPRRPTRDVDLGGIRVGPERFVLCWLGSANRDETVFATPDRFDVGRGDAGEHVGFGFGPHFCLGSHLARLETRIALRVLLEKTRDFERTTTDDLPLHRSLVFNGVTSLPLALRPA